MLDSLIPYSIPVHPGALRTYVRCLRYADGQLVPLVCARPPRPTAPDLMAARHDDGAKADQGNPYIPVCNPMSDLTESLLSMGEVKLGIQSATSVGYDTQALGLMAVAVGLAAVDIALMSDLGVLWWLPLAGLAASLTIGVATISQPEIETGQNLTLAMGMDGTIEGRRDLLLRSLADAIEANTDSLAGKRALVTLATALIGFAFLLLGVAQLLPAAYDLVTKTLV